MRGDEPPHEAEHSASGAASDGRGELGAELWRLLELAILAIPTCIGVSLVFGGRVPAMTLSALRPGWHGEPVRASLAVRLPRPPTAPSPNAGAELVIYAGAKHAFVETAPSLLELLDMSSRQITVDAHLEVPDLGEEQVARARWLSDQTVIDRALGVLLDRGLLPDDGRLEIARLAAVGGTTALEAARALLETTTDPPDSA